jgi:release factor glutamine methyltransferase
MNIPREDIEALRREKYGGQKDANMHDDLARLMRGEPLAYVIGTQPFLGLALSLDSKPLIPRPETEWWTELLIERLKGAGTSVLDVCAGSGAVGLALLKHLPDARVSFGEIDAAHASLIERNLAANGLDASRADIRSGDLFTPFKGERFSVIAANPPYVPAERALPESVARYEPEQALYAGADGLDVIRRILLGAPKHLLEGGELWMECDIENIQAAAQIANTKTEIRTDPYGRPRLLIAYY